MNYKIFVQRKFLPLSIVLLPASLSAQGLFNKGANLVLNGPVQVVLHNASFINEGVLKAGSSTVVFTGNQAVRIAGKGNALPFHHVNIRKPASATVTLEQDITVNGTITMSGGNLLLNKQTLFLTGSIAGESSQSRITGTQGGRIFLTRKVTAPLNGFNPGNIGIELTSPVAPGTINIERRHEQEILFNGMPGIHRSFNIVTQNTVSDADLRFFYLDAELAGQQEAGLALWRNFGITNAWTILGSFGNDTTNNFVRFEGVGLQGRFTIGEAGDLMIARTNGTEEQSIKRSIVNTKVNVYPNPVRNTFKLELHSSEKKETVVGLYDQWGRLLQQKKIHCRAGINTAVWDLSNYAVGMYYLAFENMDLNSIKIVKE